MHSLIAPAINLAILVGILFYYLRKPVKDSVSARGATLREQLFKMKNELDRAEAKSREVSQKLSNLENEIQSLKNQATKESETLSQEIVKAAAKNSERMVSETKDMSRDLFQNMKEELKKDLVDSILMQTEKAIKQSLSGEERIKMAKDVHQEMRQESESGPTR